MSFGTLQIEKMTTESGYSLGAGNASSFKNRIINGGMTIDQRNNGASVSITDTSNLTYTLDRWAVFGSEASKFSVQQISDAPAGFSNSLIVTSLAATTLVTNSQYTINQAIEGFNTADLSWGTASAKPVTLSFFIKSSLTGTFGGVVVNSALSRGNGFTYTIFSANTWEQKTITIQGDTSGTWVGATNGTGLRVYFSLGEGSQFDAPVGTWSNGSYRGAVGGGSVVSTNGATWQVTGVQLEVGTVATSFDFRDIGRELILCQRYFEQINETDTGGGVYAVGFAYPTDSNARMFYQFMVPKRAQPTISSGGGGGFLIQQNGVNLSVSNPIGAFALGRKTAWLNVFSVSGLTTNASVLLVAAPGGSFINFSAEL